MRASPSVLMLTTSYPLGEDSFEGRFVQRLAESLACLTSVEVLAPHMPCLPARDERRGVGIHRFRYAPDRWESLAYGEGGIPQRLRSAKGYYFLLLPLLASFAVGICRHGGRCDVIHANWSLTGFLAVATRPIHLRPVVVTLRGSDVKLAQSNPAFRLAHRCALSGADLVTAVSPALLQGVAPGKARFIPNGVDLLPQDPHRPPPEGRAYRFVAVGSLIPDKRVGRVIDAMAGLRKEGVAAELVVVGGGEDLPRLQARCADLGLADRVRFTGTLPHRTAMAELVEADCLVLASDSEGRPNVLLEAMAAAKPFVASDLPACVELAQNGKHGLVFQRGDPPDLARKMAALASDATAGCTMGARGRAYVVDQGLTWEACAARYLEVFREARGVRCAG